MAKNKADPFLSCPDGSRAKSAWLTKLQAEAQALIEKADNTTYAKLLATHTLEANSALVRSCRPIARTSWGGKYFGDHPDRSM